MLGCDFVNNFLVINCDVKKGRIKLNGVFVLRSENSHKKKLRFCLNGKVVVELLKPK